MSISTALRILVEGLGLDIQLGMHMMALASVVPVLSALCLEGTKKGLKIVAVILSTTTIPTSPRKVP